MQPVCDNIQWGFPRAALGIETKCNVACLLTCLGALCKQSRSFAAGLTHCKQHFGRYEYHSSPLNKYWRVYYSKLPYTNLNIVQPYASAFLPFKIIVAGYLNLRLTKRKKAFPSPRNVKTVCDRARRHPLSLLTLYSKFRKPHFPHCNCRQLCTPCSGHPNGGTRKQIEIWSADTLSVVDSIALSAPTRLLY